MSATSIATRPAPRWAAFVGITAAVLVVILIASLLFGARSIPFGELWTILSSGPNGGSSDEHTIVWGLRFPRTILAAAAGASLAVAGAFAQSWTRNPLADPGIIGITAGASFVVALFFSFGLVGGIWESLAALIGAAATAAIVIASTQRTHDGMRQWVVGSTVGKDGGDIAIVLTGLVLGLLLAAATARPMDILALGDDVASGLGSSPGTTRALAGVVVVVFAGMATAAVGPIVFVGFAAPHIVRPFTGPTLTRMLIPVAFVGAAVTVAGDILGRLLMRPGELEVSIVLAFVGAPFLILAVAKGMAR